MPTGYATTIPFVDPFGEGKDNRSLALYYRTVWNTRYMKIYTKDFVTTWEGETIDTGSQVGGRPRPHTQHSFDLSEGLFAYLRDEGPTPT